MEVLRVFWGRCPTETGERRKWPDEQATGVEADKASTHGPVRVTLLSGARCA